MDLRSVEDGCFYYEKCMLFTKADSGPDPGGFLGYQEESSNWAEVGRGEGALLPLLLSEYHALPGSRYLSEEEVLDAESVFVQLLSGVLWLMCNGSFYINESQAAECDET